MFETRLNPTKPPAAHRAILERVGAACRELRPLEEKSYLGREANNQIAVILAKQKVLALGIPAEFDGIGTDALLCAMAAERIGREGAAPAGFFTAHSMLGSPTVNCWGTPEQKRRYLPKAARGECLFAFALWAPGSRGSLDSSSTTFEENSTGFVLTGQQQLGTVGQVGALITFARAQADERLSAFLVDGRTPGLGIEPVAHRLGLPTVQHYNVRFHNCQLPRQSLLGEPGGGIQVARSALIGGWLGMAAAAVGVIADCLEESIAWATSGKGDADKPIDTQPLSRHIAELGVDLEAARSLVYAAAELKREYDRRPNSKHLELEAQTLVSEAKYFAGRAAYRAAYNAIEIIGHDSLTSRSARHLSDTRAAMFELGGEELLGRQIAQYYLERR